MIRRGIDCAAIAALAFTVGACDPANAPAPVKHNATAQPSPLGKIAEVDATRLAEMVKQGKAMLVDVRTPDEFAAGHIPDAINLPLETFDPANVPQVMGEQTVLYCRTGRRSEIAAGKLAAAGDSAMHLTGGIVAWEQAGKLTSKSN